MFARTDRLLLRPGFIEDAPELAAAIGDEGVVRNLARVPWPYAEADARAWLGRDHDPLRPSFLISLRTGGAPRIVGGIGIHDASGETGAAGQPELGYWIARPYWGLGFATEAGGAVLRIARAIGLPPLRASHMVDNPRSGAVLRKLGFRPTGRITPLFSLARGETVPAVLFAHAGEGGEDTPTGDRSRVPPDEDMRETLRLIAA